MVRTLIAFLNRHRLLPFLFTGGSGALLNLAVTAALTELVVGRERYFWAYLAGLLVNFVYNFVLHTRLTFRTTAGHARRLFFFLLYNIGMSILQATLVRVLVRLTGADYYLPVIAVVIATFAVVTYFFCRFLLFKGPSPPADLN